ncbi:hypothetical protein FQR65_LT06717 [Abscondita terminalis]|nr:hypothetical protein FQR65_LT06717 [Abscondita terminalis]
MSERTTKLFYFIVLFAVLINVSSQKNSNKTPEKESSSSLYKILFGIFDRLDDHNKTIIPTHKILYLLIEADIPFDDCVARGVINNTPTKILGLYDFSEVVKIAKTIIKKFDAGMVKELGNDYLMFDNGDKGYMSLTELKEMFFDVFPDAKPKDLKDVIHQIFNGDCTSDKCKGFMGALRGD